MTARARNGTELPVKVSVAQLVRSASARPRTLIDIITATASAHPDADALNDGQIILSYAELLRMTLPRDGELAAAGATGSGCGWHRASCGLYVCLLAILVAWASYVPVDADDPDERA